MVTTTYRPSLDPSNPELKIRLPPNKEAGSERVSSNGDINTVFPNAIEVAGHIAAVKGGGVFLGLMALGSSLMFLSTVVMVSAGYSDDDFPILAMSVLAGAVFFCASVSFFRADVFAYRDEPVLFNRATRKM